MYVLKYKKEFANGQTTEFSKVVSPEDLDQYDLNNMDRLITEYENKGKKPKRSKPRNRIELNEKQLREAMRQSTKNTRKRADELANSYMFKYHTVFTTTDTNISRNPRKLMDLVSKYLEKQNIKYFLILELNHPQSVWEYESDETKYRIIADPVVNAYRCYNRYALAPLQNENGYHIHVLTDKKVDFTEWIEKNSGDPHKLYSELFEHPQFVNVRYILKYAYYTKATLPLGFHIYKSNVERKKPKQNDIVLQDLDTKEEHCIYSQQKYEEAKRLIDLRRSFVTYNVILRRNFKKQLINNTTYIVLKQQTEAFYNICTTSSSVFSSCFCLQNLTLSTYLPTSSVMLKRECTLSRQGGAKKNKKIKNVINTDKIKDLKIEYRKKDIIKFIKSSKFCTVSMKNWLQKYVVYVRTIPR